MRYKIFNGPPREYHKGGFVPDLKYTGDVVMTIDPSKTNCAVVIGDPGGAVISILEMSGNNWKQGPVDDTTEYCFEIKEFLSRYIEGTNMVRIGLEKAITKQGMQHHHSNMVLTEIRGSLLSMFYDKYGFTKDDVEVNNWSWKKAILPDGYRSQSEKGSVRYFYQYLHDYTYINYFEADVTDCLCIYKYIVRETKDSYMIACNDVEESKVKYNCAIMPDWADQLHYREFNYNPSFSLLENATYFANRSRVNGIASIDVNRLHVDDIYKYASGFMEVPTGKVRLVIQLENNL